MSLSSTIEQLKKSIGRTDRAYAEGRARHLALQPYESPSAVLAAVDRGSSLNVVSRDVVLLAILDEIKTSPRQFWQSILVVAFAPMLLRFRKRLGKPGCDNLDQRVLIAFLDTARSFPHRSYVQRNLRLGTGARIRVERHREQRGAGDLGLFDDETYVAPAHGADSFMKTQTAEVIRIIEASGGQELREALLARAESDSSMRAYVDDTFPQLSPGERARLVKRLQAAELALIRKVRKRATECEERDVSAA